MSPVEWVVWWNGVEWGAGLAGAIVSGALLLVGWNERRKQRKAAKLEKEG